MKKKLFKLIERNSVEIEESEKNGIIAHHVDVDGLMDDLVKSFAIPCVICFKFFSQNGNIVEEINTNMQAPIINQYVWICGGIQYQVTSVHHDYNNNEVKIYCI
jgi:hypothetical protein